jgi:hypothetical protein
VRTAPPLHHLVPAQHSRDQSTVRNPHRSRKRRVSGTKDVRSPLNADPLPIEGSPCLSERSVKRDRRVGGPVVARWARAMKGQLPRAAGGTPGRADGENGGEADTDENAGHGCRIGSTPGALHPWPRVDADHPSGSSLALTPGHRPTPRCPSFAGTPGHRMQATALSRPGLSRGGFAGGDP